MQGNPLAQLGQTDVHLVPTGLEEAQTRIVDPVDLDLTGVIALLFDIQRLTTLLDLSLIHISEPKRRH